MQVQFTEQPENKNEVQDMLDFYRPYQLNQISVIKMSRYFDGGSVIEGVKSLVFKKGTCSNYGSYIVQPNGSVIGCCEEAFVYPKLRNKIPNLFKKSLKECQKQSDDLYLNDVTFINYCQNCSSYSRNNENNLEKKFIDSGYFAMQYATQTRYFVIPEYLRNVPDDVLLFMYENNMVSAIKNFKKG